MRRHTKIVVSSLLCWLAGTAHAQSSDDTALADSIRALTSRSSAGLRQATAADGSVGIDLQGRFRHAHVAQLGDDGNLRAQCVGSVAEANRFLGRDLDTGEVLPQPKMSPTQLDDTASLHGMSAEEYAYYWGLIEQANFVAPDAPTSSTITIQNNDSAGEGFNSAAAPFADAGNNGATLGAQRLNVFNFAAGIWAAQLDSTRTAVVLSNFDPLAPCSSGGGVLGSAGPQSAFQNFANAPFTSTVYPVALANKIANADLNGATTEIGATFNSSVDTACLGAGTRFYYGLDNATPAGRINLLVVVLHELGHGFGSLSFTDETTGAYLGGNPDVWARFQFDRTQNLTWFQMSAAQRVASAINVNNLLWDGPNVRIASGFLIAGRDAATGRVELFTPNPLQLGSSVSHWNTTANPNLLMEPAINSGLPLTLDLTRQQMRDIGWFRDANNNGVADVITNVLPSGGALTAGSNVNITWTNPPSFSRNVTIELSTDGGVTFPITIASDVANTGTRAWTVNNVTTTQGRIRVREHDFVAPAASSAANINISGNAAPSFAPAPALSRQRGSAAGANVAVGIVADSQTAAGSLVVTQISGGSATGMTVSGINNTNGNVTAAVAASCTANAGTVRFQVSDGSLTSTGDLQVNVTANTPPTLTYATSNINGGANGTLNPATGASDNGSITSAVVQSQGSYVGGISVATTGVITLTNAGPIGSHNISIRATDNCGSFTDAAFTLNVNNSAPSFTPAAAISRQQGSPGGAAVVVGSVVDGQTAPGNLSVTQIAGGSSSGVTASAVSNVAGTISSSVAASCTATAGTLRFQVSDGALNGTGNLQVDISANTPPGLNYAAASVNSGAGTAVNPIIAPNDNGSVTSVALMSAGTYSGGISVAANGVVTLTNAAPVGMHSIVIRATDNCGSTRDAAFNLTVGQTAIFANGFE